MGVYKKRKAAKHVLALCFAQVEETYHHWRVFSHGADGVRIEFHKERLLEHFSGDPRVRAGAVNYARIDDVERDAPSVDALPFLKRLPYQDEAEFRIVFTGDDAPGPYPISIECIQRISLSPWLPHPLLQSVKETIRAIDGCARIPVIRSTLIDNERWQQATLGAEE
jgi:hypothetical protein